MCILAVLLCPLVKWIFKLDMVSGDRSKETWFELRSSISGSDGGTVLFDLSVWKSKQNGGILEFIIHIKGYYSEHLVHGRSRWRPVSKENKNWGVRCLLFEYESRFHTKSFMWNPTISLKIDYSWMRYISIFWLSGPSPWSESRFRVQRPDKGRGKEGVPARWWFVCSKWAPHTAILHDYPGACQMQLFFIQP